MRAESLFNRGVLHASAGRPAEALADLEACHALCRDPAAEFPVLGDPAKEQQLVASIELRIARLRAHLAQAR